MQLEMSSDPISLSMSTALSFLPHSFAFLCTFATYVHIST